jgi:hypothetical protein
MRSGYIVMFRRGAADLVRRSLDHEVSAMTAECMRRTANKLLRAPDP